MRKLFILMFLSAGLSAQSISKQVIAPIGGTVSNGNNQLRFTAGEIVIGGMTAEDGSFQLGNGYYPSLDLEVLSIDSPKTNLLVKVYPNPTKEVIFITHPSSNSFKVFISDLTGKVLLQKQSVQCACLGTVLKLPMTEATLIENSIMIVMATVMIIG